MGRTNLRRVSLAVVFAVLCLSIAVPASGQDPEFTPGASGLGDPFFPHAGNGGYNVDHYSLALTFFVQRHAIEATATIDAHATQDLSRFNLDLRGFKITDLTVDGEDGEFRQRGQELIITPASGITNGSSFQVVIGYRGKPKMVKDPDDSFEGWSRTKDGAFVVGEPQGTPGWFPVNDYPTDKATFDFTVRVPNGLEAISNGLLLSKTVGGRWTTFEWSESAPMASYLATVTTGRFKITESTSAAGIPIYNAVAPGFVKDARRVLRKQRKLVDFLQESYGDYPFENVGAVIDKAPKIGYALETQTKPLYSDLPTQAVIAHELAHQWLGNDVTLGSWPDIWLNEGFATWSEWLWSEHIGRKTAQQIFRKFLKIPAKKDVLWNPPPARPGQAKKIFHPSIYVRGGMALQALRKRIGDETFMELIRRWIADHQYGNASTEDFIALAEEMSGQDLDHFFSVWLFQKGKPHDW
jgi:aminopeptidase N